MDVDLHVYGHFWHQRNAFNFREHEWIPFAVPHNRVEYSAHWFSPGFNMTKYGFTIWFYVFCIRKARLLPRAILLTFFCAGVCNFLRVERIGADFFPAVLKRALEVEIFYCGSICASFSFFLKVHTCTRLSEKRWVCMRVRESNIERACGFNTSRHFIFCASHLHSHQIQLFCPQRNWTPHTLYIFTTRTRDIFAEVEDVILIFESRDGKCNEWAAFHKKPQNIHSLLGTKVWLS